MGLLMAVPSDAPVCGCRGGEMGGWGCSRLSLFSLTVQLYLIQSSQNREAENFFRITTVMPWSRHWPTPTMFPEVRGVWRLRS